MRYLKYTVIFILALSIFVGVSVSASETETDWSTVDWATFDWSQVDWYAIDYNQVDWEKADIRAMIRAEKTQVAVPDRFKHLIQIRSQCRNILRLQDGWAELLIHTFPVQSIEVFAEMVAGHFLPDFIKHCLRKLFLDRRS